MCDFYGRKTAMVKRGRTGQSRTEQSLHYDEAIYNKNKVHEVYFLHNPCCLSKDGVFLNEQNEQNETAKRVTVGE